MIYSNIVPEKKVREVQRETLDVIATSLEKSFGPNGSTTAIIKNIDQNGTNISVEYTKDGHTIVKNIQFMNPIERSVQDILTELTRYVVKEVGDGTTSAILLCRYVFNELCDNKFFNLKNYYDSADLINMINTVISDINSKIMERSRECTIDDIYNIALISSNNNEEIAGTIKAIYEKFGMDVFIEVGISNEVDNIVKEYDGMVLDTGYTDICFVNEKDKNRASIKNPKIYCFNDPIDTPEMLSMLDAILDHNILRCYKPGSMYEPIPTVIFGKGISPDTSSYFETVVKLMNAYPGAVPLLMVTDIHQDYMYEDIAKMCGAPFIKKYLNPELQEKDIEAGLAPTVDNICDFCGSADLVQADQVKTKIINPAKMFNEDGSYSDEYTTMLSYLETQVEKAKNEDAGIEQIARTKRRLNSFKGNMVDFLIGGITIADRNNLKASVEDAVLNCRSASINGVGYGANYMAYTTLYEQSNYDNNEYEYEDVINLLVMAYEELIYDLYKNEIKCEYDGDYDEFFKDLRRNKCPLNIRTQEYDHSVVSSIKSDVIILETIGKILTLMFTCNQYLLQTPAYNVYTAYDASDSDD